MSSMPATQKRFQFIDMAPAATDSCTEILHGLTQPQKVLSPRFFYDNAGSALFEQITRQPEYYPTRVERQLLDRHAGDIAEVLPPACTLIEPGAGSCEKVRLLLDAVQPGRYVPLDIAGSFLCQSVDALCLQFPHLPVTAIAADFADVQAMDREIPEHARVVFYPGSTLGNFTPDQACQFLHDVRFLLGPQGQLLIGVDRHKERSVLDAAYNDAARVTERFNLNALRHVNRVARARFELDDFEHLAFYNEAQRRIEMHLRSRRSHQVPCAGHDICFEAGETIRTEYSYKYTPDSFAALAERAGLAVTHHWQDDRGWFSLFLCQAG